MFRKLFIYCLALLPLAGGTQLLRAQHGQLPAEREPSASAVVWGIISYTRWPQPQEPLRLCVVGDAWGKDALQRSSDRLGPQRSATVRDDISAEDVSSDCDVVYVGRLAQERLIMLVASVTGKPVLTIGEERDFCSFGGMFCLNDAAVGARFAANLDAISRSGLRINPQVLRLTRQVPEQP